jgi:hypothetical protein
MKRIYFLLILGLAWIAVVVSGCATYPPAGVPPTSGTGGATPGKPLPAPPVITQSFASPKLRPGQTWKVYLIASDPNGEMRNIVSTVYQPGRGEYPIAITRIFPGASELNGYIYLATSAFAHLDFISLTLTVQVQDAAGQYSKPVQFPLSLNDLYQQEPLPPGIFKEHDLGPIMVNVRGFRGEGPGLFFPGP